MRKSMLRAAAVIAMGTAALLGRSSIATAEQGACDVSACVASCPGDPVQACKGWDSSCSAGGCGGPASGVCATGQFLLTCRILP